MACPDDNTLAAYMQGQLDTSRRSVVERHVDSCSVCAEVMAELGRFPSLADPHGPTMRSPIRGPSGTLQVEAPPALVRRITPSMVPAPGAPLGRYVVEEILGEGGMGVVLRARDPVLARPVAVKLIRPELGSRSALREESSQRLLVEARAMATLNHPNVVAVHDAGQHGDTVFIAMELVPGTTLDAWLRIPRRPPEIIDAFIEAAQGLQAAHDAGILHRDFKPENVLVGPDGRMRVTDFGLARSVDPQRRGNTAPGAVVGTPAYMAPEQLFGQPTDQRADQFSLCVALWEALFGARPYDGRDLDGLRWSMMNQRLAIPLGRGEVPRAVIDALMKGLRISPAERHSSMRALIDALRDGSTREAEGHIKVHALAQTLFSLAHVAVLLFFLGTGSSQSSSSRSSSSNGDPEFGVAGAIFVIWLLLQMLFAISGVAWAPLNAFGLWRRQRWARISTLAYGFCALFTVIGIPYGVYALWSLRRPPVRDAFGQGPSA